jgi:chromosome segregation ATPase
MGRWQILLVALVPAAVIATLFIGLMTWRERAALEDARRDLHAAQQQHDEMQRLGASLTEARKDAKAWKQRWETDTKRLTDDLAKAAGEVASLREAAVTAAAELGEREARLKDLEAQLKAAAQPAPK